MTIADENTAEAPVGSSAGYEAFDTITSFVPAATAARNGASRAVRKAALRPIVTGLSSVLATAPPRPGKCFAVAATCPDCRPAANALASAATSEVSLPKARVPRKLLGVEIVSATGAKSMPTPAARSITAAATA